MLRKFKISVDGHPYDVIVEEMSDTAGTLYPDGGAMKAEAHAAGVTPAAPASEVPHPPTAAAGPGDIVSPLAGVVLSLSVSVGDEVEDETRIAVIEAMKMKTVVLAHRDGKITDIAVEVGQSVEAGQVLMTVG